MEGSKACWNTRRCKEEQVGIDILARWAVVDIRRGVPVVLLWAPPKRIGNVLLFGVTAMKFSDSKVRDLPDSEWQPIANAYWKWAKILNSTGFALVALGTLLQVVGVCL